MRALWPLLAALTAASAAPPAPRPLALVLRAACDETLRAAFDEARLLSYEPARFLFDRYRVQLLNYEGAKILKCHSHSFSFLNNQYTFTILLPIRHLRT